MSQNYQMPFQVLEISYQFSKCRTGAPSDNGIIGRDHHARLRTSDASNFPAGQILNGLWVHVSLARALVLAEHQS